MLEMRPGCECCDVDLPADTTDAFICSFECTYCRGCRDALPGNACPNCGGELVLRPRRTAEKLITSPASNVRVIKVGGCQAVG
jgi:uncharacterized protein